MRVVQFEQPPPTLRRPVLVAAFKGWNDAGEAASGAVQMLWEALEAQTFAWIDPEEFFDFQLTRPTVRSVSGGGRAIDWPDNRFGWAELPGADRHVVLLDGTEPNLRWRTFSEGIADLALTLDVEMVLTVGALQVDVPHTRPVPVTGSAGDVRLASRLGLSRSTYEGPTGMTGVLHQACAKVGMEVVSLWGGVPHYLSGTPYLNATLSLTDRIVRVLDADVPLDELEREAASQVEDLRALLDEDEDLAEYVAELEDRFAEGDEDPLPEAGVTGDELAEEFQRYLRDRGGH
ncbi:MAG TPA: PAC2 family protein [Egibacteraceae bacterium]|nr:PAC2 family protein [Egibacteraceae bacterium]